ncbi:dihydrolipoamide acetyltransferase family protein [Ilumatobacter coccineus]|uniref:Dihydrolipoamide acetyltransferase component of pyruvate dehydrogenase complex n=1 Tax=Ilumatobacter coccineus (strain NBRC 103263 / KCTC 29153 / YM16-304) TaxID=1313172 RepID=A0A6C7E389_ILUCY|nr:dihydrolipoamide acetyltransferase family protein [Ilumatobacter coccineus]BAN01163.1 dihydrolipoamide acetyltransferase [Ilumatobacter coccineus YM16-304]
MSTEFQMPKLGLTMEEGTIVEWLVADGSEITVGQPVLVIETDKTETEVEAAATGVLHQTGAPGDTFACGASIGQVLAPGEAPSAAAAAPAPSAAPTPAAAEPEAAPAVAASPAPAAASATGSGGRLLVSPNARRVAAERGIDVATVTGTGPDGRITSEDVLDVADGRVAAVATAPAAAPAASPAPAAVAPAPAPAAAGSPVPASIAARQLADLLGVDLASVPADPTDGRVTRDGVAAHVRGLLSGSAASSTSAGSVGATGGSAPAMQEPTETIRLSGMRGTIAKRMYASLQETAQLTLTMDADMDAVVADRTARKDAGNAPGFTDYVIAASARALRDHPRVNSQITEAGVALLPEIHVGLAVALDEGLIVPVVKNADKLSLGQLGPETTRLAEGARNGSLGPDDVQGGTFSVTALGMFGVDSFTPVINPPNSAILGVGRLRDDVIVVDGDVRTTKRLTLSLTWDHRVFDGAPAAEFAQTICKYLADPSSLV